MPKPKKSATPHRLGGSHITDRHGATPASSNHPRPPKERPYVTAIAALNRIGWRVTELRSDFDVPGLWRVTIGRYDAGMSITAIAADPDDALNELARYAAAGEDER